MNCQITEKVFDVLRLIQEEEKRPKDYGTGQPLYHAEMEFLDAVWRYPQAHASALAAHLGVTKGAVSPYNRKLGEKGLVEWYLLEGNRKEKFLRLTELGERAREGHIRFHEEANRALCDYFCSLNQEETDLIFDFLNHLKECVPFCEFTCRNVHP
ncbi:MAG: hypothetical protein LIO46_04705 [Clostridiales bacterium]|nr:hypothetical protein [Clostridiales bacterium]